MPDMEVVVPCTAEDKACVRPPVRAYRFSSGHNISVMGDAFYDTTPIRLIKLTQNLFRELGAMLLRVHCWTLMCTLFDISLHMIRLYATVYQVLSC